MGLFSSIGGALGVLNPVGLIGTAASIAGPLASYFGTQATNSANSANVNATNAANLTEAQANNAVQMDLAQHGLAMKVADGASVGISPLASIGAADPSFSPSMAVMQPSSYSSPWSAAAPGISDFGQNLTRAFTAQQDPSVKAYTALDLRNKSLQNDLLETQLQHARLSLIAHSSPPGIPGVSDTQVMVAPDGTQYLAPSSEFSQASHGDIGAQWGWALDNKIIPGVEQLGTNMMNYIPNNLIDLGKSEHGGY